MLSGRVRRTTRVAFAILSAASIASFLTASNASAEANDATPLSTISDVNNMTAQEKGDLIEEFVGRASKRWNLDLNSSEYRVVTDSHGISIVPSTSPDLTTSSPVANSNGTESTFEVADTIPPPQLMNGAKTATVAQDGEISWFAPYCWARVEVRPAGGGAGTAIGQLDRCYQMGHAHYANQDPNYISQVIRNYLSCTSLRDNYAMTKCGVQFSATKGMDPLQWLDWSPKSDMNVSDTCQNVSLSVGYLGIGASHSFNLCDKLLISKGNDPLQFTADWNGKAVQSMREAASLLVVSIGTPGKNAGVHWKINIGMGICAGGTIFDKCPGTSPIPIS